MVAAARTEYVVLRGDAEEKRMVIGHVMARSASSAIQKMATGEGEYVAVPLRSWQPVTATVETQTRMVLS